MENKNTNKIIIQYFIFDKSGNDILEANAFVVENENDKQDLLKEMITSYHTNEEFKDLQLLISCQNQVLFNSKEEQR